MYGKVKVTQLECEGCIVGVRTSIIYGNGISIRMYDMSIALNDIHKILSEVGLQYEDVKRSVKGILRDGVIVFSNDWMATEIKSREEMYFTLKREKSYLDKLAKFASNFESMIYENIELPLNSMGIYYKEKRYDSNSLCFSCRFLGGFDSWSGGMGDICDADVLNPKIAKKVKSILNKFNKKYGTNAIFQTSEKAWSYIYIA